MNCRKAGSGVLWNMHLLWLYCLLLVLIRKIEKGRLLEKGAKTPLWLAALFYQNGANYADKPVNRSP